MASELIGLDARNRKLSRNVHTLKSVPMSLRTSIEHLLECTSVLLASLRWDAPERLFDVLCGEDLIQDARWHSMARAAVSRPGQVQRLMLAATSELQVAIEAGNTSRIAPVLWAIATSLWGDEAAIEAVAGQIEALAECCIRILSRIADDWRDRGIAQDLLSEAAVILLALLRSRGTPAGTCIRAGGTLSSRAADALVKSQIALRETRALRRPRIRLERELAPEEVYDEIVSAIQGHRLIVSVIANTRLTDLVLKTCNQCHSGNCQRATTSKATT